MIAPESWIRLLDRRDGQGRLHDGDRLLDEVRYALRDVETVHDPDLPGETHARVVETRTLCGIVTPSRMDLFPARVGKPLTLELQDGQRLGVAVTRVGDTFLLIKGLAPPGR